MGEELPDGSPAAPALHWRPSPRRLVLLLLLPVTLAAEPDPRDLPPALWEQALQALELTEAQVGYSPEQMAPYGGATGLLPGVLELFRGPRPALRATGKLSDDLVAAQATPDEQLRLLFKLLGASTGRRVPVPGLDPGGTSGEVPTEVRGATAGQPPAWGHSALPDGTPAAGALGRLLSEERRGRRDRDRALSSFATLPEPVQRLVVRLVVASLQAGPWVQAAVAETPGAGLPPQESHALLSALRAEEEWPGSTATLRREAITALSATDLAYLGFAAVLWTKQLRLALEEFDAAGGAALLQDPACRGFGELELPTPGGPLLLTDGEGRAHARDPAPMLVVDLGGDDTWTGRFAVSSPWPVSAMVELGGADRYLPAPGQAATLATGMRGIGALVDRAGDDHYEAQTSSLAAAWHGAGILLDSAGDDTYRLHDRWGSAAAHVGVALLVDQQGEDQHQAAGASQGMGGPLGAALLMDVAGDDRYTIPDDAEPSALYLGRTVAMSQGCGYGRRADMGDGHSLAGGYGLLIDGAGDDRYHAMAWSQGAAYWWGVGLLDDRGGDDVYRNGKYSLGAGAHFGVGVQVDHAGDDRYNAEPERFTDPFRGVEDLVAENQFQGHGRDGSLGLSLDLGGGDVYLLRSHSGGSGDLGSVGLFYEREGDDRYLFLPPADPAGLVPALGSTTHYPEPFRSWRDDLFTVGVFLDGGGQDLYEGLPQGRGEGLTWTERLSARERAVGVDAPAGGDPPATQPR